VSPISTSQIRRNQRMTQPVRLTMQDMAVIREALVRQIDGINAATLPFGLSSTWDAATRPRDALGKITVARCALKRRQHPDYNPLLDSECASEATDADFERLTPEQRAILEARYASEDAAREHREVQP
jgi:hypothetical protein